MLTFFALVLVFSATLLILLAPPITITYSVQRTDQVDGYVNLRGWFGLFHYRLALNDATRKRIRKPALNRAKRQDTHNTKTLFNLLRQSAFRHHLWRYVKELMRALHADGVFLHAQIGLQDPHDTGMLWAWIGTFTGIARAQSFADIRITPDFLHTGFSVQSGGRFQLYPLHILALSARFVASPVSLRAWRNARQFKART